MAVTRKITKTKKKKVADDDFDLPGPDDINTPSEDFWEYFTVIYGAAGVGKTSFCASIPNCVVFQFEPKRRNLPIRMVEFRPRTVAELEKGEENPWKKLIKLLAKAEEDKSIDVICIDNIAECYRCCEMDYLLEEGMSSIPRNDFGYCRGQVTQRFEQLFNNFKFDSRLGCIFTCHLKEQESELNTGTTDNIYGPNVSKAVFDYLKKAMDFAFYYGPYNDIKAMHVRWNGIWTKCGLSNVFLTPKGKPISAFEIPSVDEDSWRDGWNVFLQGWNNELQDCTEPEEEEEESAPKKRKRRK